MDTIFRKLILCQFFDRRSRSKFRYFSKRTRAQRTRFLLRIRNSWTEPGCRIFQINLRHLASQVTPRTAEIRWCVLRVFTPPQAEEVHDARHKSYQFAERCLFVAPPPPYPSVGGFFSLDAVPTRERAPSIRFSRGMYCYVPFSLTRSPCLSRLRSFHPPSPFVFISSARQ